MSNLAHGSVRLRGKRNDIKLFLEKELRTRKETIVPTGRHTCTVDRTEYPAIISDHGRYLLISRVNDAVRGFYFATENSGQFIHAFDQNHSFRAYWARKDQDNDAEDVLYLDMFSARYEEADTNWFLKKTAQYWIDIRIFLTEFESGVPDNIIYSYTFDKAGRYSVAKIDRYEAFWVFPDKRQLRIFDNSKKGE